MEQYVLAIDEGTTSARAIVFDHSGSIISVGQREFTQIFPHPGWAEHDPVEVWGAVRAVVAEALQQADIKRHALAAVGITNQRETTVVWDRNTGEPVCNAIVWQDTRTAPFIHELEAAGGPDRFRDVCGLRLSPYFPASKIRWILDNVPGARERAEAGDLCFGNMDSWVLWNLTGGVHGGVHITDVTNASRTMLMDIRTLAWRPGLCEAFGVPMLMLPEIRSSSEIYGYGRKNGLLIDTPVAGILGDQQAAAFGQACFRPGMAKNTYGTGCFMLLNTGEEPVFSRHGLLTTVAYRLGGAKPAYALEGSVAVAGSVVQWLRDNLGIIKSSSDIAVLASSVEDNGGVYFVPAFSGLFAPYWQDSARGAIVGLTRYATAGHIARAAEESIAFQVNDVLDAMDADIMDAAIRGFGSRSPLARLTVDGGAARDDMLMQFQADVSGVDVVRPKVVETTALGAAYAAGLAAGFWSSTDELAANWQEDKRWTPCMDVGSRRQALRRWKKAVARAFDWAE